ncbi:MAG: hypothetical protein NT119_00625 [Actinobacteria bacterium]|nr:hypothetical protein [Actinomycetota bacterium]
MTGSFEFVLSMTGNSKSEDAMRIGRIVSTLTTEAGVFVLVLELVQAEIVEAKQMMARATRSAYFAECLKLCLASDIMT